MKLIFLFFLFNTSLQAKTGATPDQILPAQTSGGVNRGDSWTATTGGANPVEILKDNLGTDPKPNQMETFVTQSNILYGCVDKSLNGRTDANCAADPSNPECLGLSKSLDNATVCREYYVPASLGCKIYGAGSYYMDEWLAFGDHFYSSVTNCGNTKTAADSKIGKFTNLTDMLTYNSANPVGNGTQAAKTISPSGISQTTKDGDTVEISALEKLAETFDDGASKLGYEKGEILRKAAKGESFLQVVLDSPFADKLNEPSRKKVEESIKDSTAVTSRVIALRESSEQQKGEEIQAVASQEIPSEGKSGITEILSVTSRNEIPTPRNDAALRSEVEGIIAQKTKPLLADRIAALEEMAKNAKNLSGRNLASETKASLEPEVDSTLFERIHLAYKKRHLSLRSQDSITGKAVRSLEKPAFFKDL